MAEPLEPLERVDLAVVGAGVAACSLAAALRRRGWGGSLRLLEIGRGPGGRASTRRSRTDPALAINHGAPLFNIAAPAPLEPPELLAPLLAGGWIVPCRDPIRSLGADGAIGPAIPDPLTTGTLWRGAGGMENLCRGLLALAAEHPGVTQVCPHTLVRGLQPHPGEGWTLRDPAGTPLLQARWLVLSSTLPAHPRCTALFGWGEVPLQRASAALQDPDLARAAAALAALEVQPSLNLLLVLPQGVARPWLAQEWRLLGFTPAARERWGLRRISLQPLPEGRCAVVAESTRALAARYPSREACADATLLEVLEAALQHALGLPTAGGERQLMRWGGAFPRAPGLPQDLALCPASRIGFCGDGIEGPGFGRVEGALRSATALAEQLLPWIEPDPTLRPVPAPAGPPGDSGWGSPPG